MSLSVAHLSGNVWSLGSGGYVLVHRNALLVHVAMRLDTRLARFSLTARPAVDLEVRPLRLIGDSVEAKADFLFLNERLRSILSLEWCRFPPVDPSETLRLPFDRLEGGRASLSADWRVGVNTHLHALLRLHVDPAFSTVRLSGGIGVSAGARIGGEK